MKDLLDLLNKSNYTSLFISSLIFIFVWLFKDMKKSLLETKKSDLNFIDESIESHAKSLKAINFFLNNSISKDDLLDTLYSSYKYFDKSILDTIDKFTSSSYIITSEERSAILINLTKQLKDKINILKDKQLHLTIDKKYKLSIFNFWDMSSRNNFEIYYNAFLYSLVVLSVSLCILELVMQFYILEHQIFILLVALIIAYVFWLFLLPISIELLLKKYYKKRLLFILFFLSPFVSAYLIYICQSYIIKIFILIIFIMSILANFFINLRYSKLIYKK